MTQEEEEEEEEGIGARQKPAVKFSPRDRRNAMEIMNAATKGLPTPASFGIGQQLADVVKMSAVAQLASKPYSLGDVLGKQAQQMLGINQEARKQMERMLGPLHEGLAKQMAAGLGAMNASSTIKSGNALAGLKLADSALMKSLSERRPLIDPAVLKGQREQMRGISEAIERSARFDAKVKNAALESLEVQRDVARAMDEIVTLNQQLVTAMNTMDETLEEIQTEQARAARRRRWPMLALSLIGSAAALGMLGLTVAWHYFK